MTTVAEKREEKRSDTVPLDWKEVYYTNCPLVSASNVDQELGWTKEEFKKIGVKYAFLRSQRGERLVPALHPQPRQPVSASAVCSRPIHVHADIRRTVLLGVTHAPHEGGCMMVRARDDIYRMKELKGKKIGLSKSLNTIKNDWWRIQEHQGIELMLRMNDMTMADVQIVEFPYPDDWYDKPEMLDPMENPSELWLKRDHKHDLAFRPLETALEKGVVDAIYTQSKPFQHLQEATGKFKAIEDLSRYPDWTLQVANIPAVITCTDVMAREAPRARRDVHEGDDQGGTLGQRAQARRGGDPRQADVLPGRRGYVPRASSTSTWCLTCRRRTWSPSRSGRTSC